MQIIIVQAEIETAIRNHILQQVSVNDGMEIDIDLKATRGADGYQAVIDIRPANTPKAEVQPQAQAQETAPTRTRRPRAQAAETAPVAQETATTGTETGDAGDEPVINTGDRETASDEAAETAEESATDTAPRQSIFGGLNKPSNATADA